MPDLPSRGVSAALTRAFVFALTALPAWSPGVAHADPAPAPPPLPDVNSYPPLDPAGYTAMGGTVYAFAGPAGVTCVLNRVNGGYGCSGPLPGAPDGVNLVSGGPVGAPAFAVSGRPIFVGVEDVKALPPGSRLSFREISCGADAAGSVACVNNRDQVGFVISATTTVISSTNPMLGPPDGANPG